MKRKSTKNLIYFSSLFIHACYTRILELTPNVQVLPDGAFSVNIKHEKRIINVLHGTKKLSFFFLRKMTMRGSQRGRRRKDGIMLNRIMRYNNVLTKHYRDLLRNALQ